MDYYILSGIAVSIFALVHLLAKQTRHLDELSHGRLLSIGGGISIAYVFVDLMPKLCKSDVVVKEALGGIFPYVERNVFIFALAGFLLFFLVDRGSTLLRKKEQFWLSLTSYTFFNFLVGYAVADKENPEVKPLMLFTLAMALHYFVNDYSLSKENSKEYKTWAKWILICSLFLGWFVGSFFALPPAGVALISAFIGGGVIMNVTRHELPKENPHSTGAFLFGVLLYTVILLSIGE